MMARTDVDVVIFILGGSLISFRFMLWGCRKVAEMGGCTRGKNVIMM